MKFNAVGVKSMHGLVKTKFMYTFTGVLFVQSLSALRMVVFQT